MTNAQLLRRYGCWGFWLVFVAGGIVEQFNRHAAQTIWGFAVIPIGMYVWGVIGQWRQRRRA